MQSVICKVDRTGRVLIPAEWRRKQGIRPDSEVVMSLDDNGSLRLDTREQRLRRAQELVRKYVPPGVSLVEELIRERRAEAKRELAD